MMNKPQWIFIGISIIIVIGLYAATEKQFFGPPPHHQMQPAAMAPEAVSVDSILFHAKEHLSAEQLTRLNLLEHSISRGDVKDQQLHIFHQLARFWADSARKFEPFAWYTAEAARLENSEKSLTFAAHLFLNNLVQEDNPTVKQWEAFQAKDLFERSLKLNPDNDSSKVGLGAVYVYGDIAMPMQGIGLIREVADRDSSNVYALWTLAKASITSGQLDKAMARLKRLAQVQPENTDVYLLAAGVAEEMGDNTEAIHWYTVLLEHVKKPEVKKAITAKIAELKK
jgi:tetratricopeptide (TPR) repeat protein